MLVSRDINVIINFDFLAEGGCRRLKKKKQVIF